MAHQIVSPHRFQYGPEHHPNSRRSQSGQQEFEADNAYGDKKYGQGIRHEVASQDQESGHGQDSFENSRYVSDRNISPDDIVNGKGVERDRPCDDDTRQKGNKLVSEIIRDSAFEADEICREQRESEDNKVAQTFVDFAKKAT
jgi:hypothetical protein